MKKLLALVVLSVMMVSVSAQEWISFDSGFEQEPSVNVVASDDNRLILDINVSGMYLQEFIENGQTYQKIEMIEGRTTHDVGFPELPMITRIIGIPENQNVRVKVLNTSTIQLQGYNIFPLQTPQKDGDSNQFVVDSKFYMSNDSYPSNNAFVGNVGIWRDVKIGGFHFIPFNFNAGSGTLEVTTSARVEIEFYGFDNEFTLNKDKKITPDFYNLYDSALINFSSMGYEILRDREVDIKYLIVTNTSALASIQPFVDLKNQQGMPVEVRTLETGFETATQIKDYIMQLYNSDDLEYVLMVGDAYPNGSGGPDNVPMYLWSGGGTSSWSDSWYSCMGGNTDYYADIAIGRITYDNIAELDHQMLKLMDFYQTPDQTTNWGENSILVAHSQEYPLKYTQCKQQIMDFPYAVQTPIFTQCYGGAGATNTDIISWVNSTSGGIFNYRGHGSETELWEWGASGSFTATHVNQLTNDNRNFVMFDVCCSNMDIVGYSGNCLAETFMKADEAAIAINGAINPSYTIPNHDYDKESYKAIFNEGINNIGYITNYANVFVVNLHGNIGIANVLTYLWLGDSSIEPWTLQIDDLNVSHDGQLFLGMSTFDVTVMGTSGPVENARVCVSNDDGTIYAVSFTDVSGFAQVQFDGPVQNPGTAHVSAQSHNYLRYQQDVPVIPQTGPYCVYAGNTINDTSGNANGELDYGESVLMSLDIENVGVQQADDVTVEISTADAYITITDDTEVYGDIGASSTVSITDGFAFDVAGNVPDGHYVMFEVAAISGTNTWNSSFSIECFAPALDFLEFLVDDTVAGNGDFMWDAGETVDIYVTLENTGSSTAFNVEGLLSTIDPFITLNTTTVQAFGDISTGSTEEVFFNATSSLATPEAHMAEFIIDYTADLGITGSGTFSTQIGGYMIEEYFGTFPPADWTTTGGSNWGGNNGNSAGGTSPEAEFYWSPSTTGFQRLISMPINTTGSASLQLSFQHMVNDYNGAYTLRVQTTSDGSNWNDVWSMAGTNVNAELLEMEVTTPDVGSSTFQIAWVFDGNSYNINYWYVDDVILGGGTTSSSGTVAGFVTDVDTGNPIAGADISGLATSGTDGSYTFDITPGTFNFTCSADGYFDLTMEDVVVVEEQTTDLDFEMQSSNSPTNLEASIVNYNEVELSWDTPTDLIVMEKRKTVNTKMKNSNQAVTRELIGYNVYMDSDLLEQITGVTYSVLALDAGNYEFFVTAVYDEGESVSSNVESITIILPTVENLVASSAGNDIVLNWEVPQRDLMEYKVYRDGEEIGSTTEITYTDASVPAGNYTYAVSVIYDGGYESDLEEAVIEHTDVNNLMLPLHTELSGNYPNPFNPTTTISFSMIEAGYVSVNIYNMKGQLVKTLVNEHLEAAYHNVLWNGKDNSNKTVSSGIYYYKMNTHNYSNTKKMILMK